MWVVPKTIAYFLKQHESILEFSIFVAGQAHVKQDLDRALSSHIRYVFVGIWDWRLDKILNPNLLWSVLDSLSCNLQKF